MQQSKQNLKLHQIQNSPTRPPSKTLFKSQMVFKSTETNPFLSSNFPTTQTHTTTKFKPNILLQIIIENNQAGQIYFVSFPQNIHSSSSST